MSLPHHKVKVLLGLVLTLAILRLITNRLLVLAILLSSWSVLFWPFTIAELVLSLVAAGFFTVQNYVCLKAGLFEFRFKDVFLMPYYEPALWAFYFLSLKRFVSGTSPERIGVDMKSVLGLIVTTMAFSFLSFDSRMLLIATGCSTLLLFVFFHTPVDVRYAVSALTLGLIVEVFGVTTGLWSYPTSDFLGVPYWFATMWMSVGLLGRRFLLPASEWVAGHLEG